MSREKCGKSSLSVRRDFRSLSEGLLGRTAVFWNYGTLARQMVILPVELFHVPVTEQEVGVAVTHWLAAAEHQVFVGV